MIAVALCTLALVDAAFSGFRAHAGRDGRIAKRRAKASAALTGLVAGVGALLFLAAMLLLAIALDLTSYDQLVDAGVVMLRWYAIYAAAITLGFVGYFSPWLEVRSLATMLLLGPGTFVRPAVIAAGAVVAGLAGGWMILALALIAAATMLAIEPLLSIRFDRFQASSIPPYAPARRRRNRLTRSA